MKPFSLCKKTLGIVLVMGLLAVGSAHAITFTTAQSQFDPGVNNQGWWSNTDTNVSASNTNDSYALLTLPDGQISRNFFTFDLSSLNGTAIEATFFLLRGNWIANEPQEVVEFFDVSTDAATLNFNEGLNSTIFDDLGSGTSYGRFLANDGPDNQFLSFNLQRALDDINATSGFFSIGGSLISGNPPESIFGGVSNPARLEIVLESPSPGPSPAPVPEPSTLVFFGTGLAGLVGWRIRKSRG